MKETNASLIGIIILMFLTIVLVFGAQKCANSDTALETVEMYEWVSPDGVHYWYKIGIYGQSFIAPRYDKNGNLVIDE